MTAFGDTRAITEPAESERRDTGAVRLAVRRRIIVRCPDIDAEFVDEHLSRLGERYVTSFTEPQLIRHVRAAHRLRAQTPADVSIEDVSIEASAFDRFSCTVVAFDYRDEFALITGVLGSLGLSIEQGHAFTYARDLRPAGEPGPAARRRRVRRRIDPRRAPLTPSGDTGRAGGRLRARVVDRFIGRVPPARAARFAERAAAELRSVLALLERDGRDVAKRYVDELVARAVSADASEEPILYPVEVHTEMLPDGAGARPGRARLAIASQDTPFFLYSFATALSTLGVVIDQVVITTQAGRIADEFVVSAASGATTVAADDLAHIELAALLTKQFTHFLGRAPDPFAALGRFGHLAGELLQRPSRSGWAELLSDSAVLRGLARLLGASDYLWEDFVRLQYETLLPRLRDAGATGFAEPAGTCARRLAQALERAPADPAARKQALNDFKDREVFLLDLDHLLTEGFGFRELSERLTELAEAVVAAAVAMAFDALGARYGAPCTFAGLESRYAVLALGKFGGRALGYASDIELLFVYSDQGSTTGANRLPNREFYQRLVRDTEELITAKREGIFDVDTRLRPYGESGPLACSLETFAAYYGVDGAALSYERLALVRLRAVAGDAALGARIERLRDSLLYTRGSLDMASLADLRGRQVREKCPDGVANAKFSPGGLVDVEYTVQILQVVHGSDTPALRTPSVHAALDELRRLQVIDQGDAQALADSYDFLRRLINGLRMLRGSARDLLLPATDSAEYAHLARRIGYGGRGGLGEAAQLRTDFEVHTAAVRSFVDRRFGDESVPWGAARVGPADLVLAAGSDRPPGDAELAFLRRTGFRDAARAMRNVAGIASRSRAGEPRRALARLMVLAFDDLRRSADPDMALNNWERFVAAQSDPEAHLARMLEQPVRLALLLSMFATSQFLVDTLVRHPQFLDWIADERRLHGPRSIGAMLADLRALSAQAPDRPRWLRSIRLFRRRELLRIAARDFYLGAPIAVTTGELATMAEAVVTAALERIGADLFGEPHARGVAVLAFGKLGGSELNYSSDIDLVTVYDDAQETGLHERAAALTTGLRQDLSEHTGEQHAYRVDLRLRPYGGSGELVTGAQAFADYYERRAGLWEVQALLRCRAVAGDVAFGERLIERLQPVVRRGFGHAEVADTIGRMRDAHAAPAPAPPGVARLRRGIDVKNGRGGIRDVEFLVQGLQLTNAREHPQVLTGHTPVGIERLAEAGLLAEDLARALAEDYALLRRTEHLLQVLDDRQVHAIPAGGTALIALARRLLGAEATERTLVETLAAVTERVYAAYRAWLEPARAHEQEGPAATEPS